jgi:spore cortex formation protein SpoVR/YcgB (stage V sporulation)
MPVNYHHWSFGKHFLATEKGYKRGQMGLAYEIVINSNPCIAYLMEENTMMQALVIAHAAYGHNSFFKGNYLFRSGRTPTHHRLPGLRQELHHRMRGAPRPRRGRALLDSCHALMNSAWTATSAPASCRSQGAARQREREQYLQSQVNDLWRTLPPRAPKPPWPPSRAFRRARGEPAVLHREERAAARALAARDRAHRAQDRQYFYPQRQTQVMNEGWATFWHYTLLNTCTTRAG